MCPNSLQQQVTRRDTNSRMQIRLSARSTSFGETLRLEIKGFVIARFPALDFPWKNRNPSNKNIRRESSFFFVSDLAQSPSPRRRKAWWVVRERERGRTIERTEGGEMPWADYSATRVQTADRFVNAWNAIWNARVRTFWHPDKQTINSSRRVDAFLLYIIDCPMLSSISYVTHDVSR